MRTFLSRLRSLWSPVRNFLVRAELPAATPAEPPEANTEDQASPERPHAKAANLAQVLVDLGFIAEDQLWEIVNEAETTGRPTGQVALERGFITEDQLWQAVAERHGLALVNLKETKPTPEAIALVPKAIAEVYKALPLAFSDGILTVAVGDPNGLPCLEDLRNFLGVKEVRAVLAPPEAIEEATTWAYGPADETILDIINQLERDEPPRRVETSIDLASLMEIQDAAPVRKLLNMVILLAIRDRASDIHFEPFEEEYKLRYRADGVLMELVPPPRHLATAIATRIKVMANLNVGDTSRPQHGLIELNVGGNPVNMRVHVIPTMFGESVVIRLLDRTIVQLDLNRLGMEPPLLSRFRKIMRKPVGLVLLTGTPCSGKTTTMLAALAELNEVTDKIMSLEDPVEYEIDGIVQCRMPSPSSADALGPIFEQSPDILVVGEIRDAATARLATQAALGGRAVFTTLNAADIPASIARLRGMGLESAAIAGAVKAVLAQRLVRKICDDCRTPFEPSPEMLAELKLRPEQVRGKTFFYGRGCQRCNNSGYRGRAGIFELVRVNDELRERIADRASSAELRSAYWAQGMTTLREAGLNALYTGVSTIDEVARATAVPDEV